MSKTLRTNTSVWSGVFRRIVQQLEIDPDIQRVVGVSNLRSWKGVPGDRAPFEPTATSPVVRLTPQPANVDWYSPDAQLGTLNVLVEIAVQSLCVDDVADLWETIVQPLRPGADDAQGGSFALDLVALGAETGEIVFSDPAFDPKPWDSPEGVFLAAGRFHLRIVRQLNP